MSTDKLKNERAAVLGVLSVGVGLQVHEVARRAGLSGPAANRCLSALVEDGAVRVARSVRDRRVVTYSLA